MARTRPQPEPKSIAEYLADALAVEGGHLFIGGGGWFLRYAAGATLHAYDLAAMKARCAAAKLPVIDILRGPGCLPLMAPALLPMVAVGRPPDSEPWCPSFYAPLRHVAALWREAGAEIINLPGGR